MSEQSFKIAEHKIKLKNVIQKLKQEATFQSGHWSSSLYFEQDLKKNGIIPPIEIYHQYKMPDGYSEKEYEDYIMWLFELIYFDSDRIMNIPKYIDKITYGTDMSEQEKQDYKNQLEKTISGLSDLEKQQIVNMIIQDRQSAPDEIYNQIKLIKSLNPELKDINIPRGKESDFLIGVTSCFHPDDIKYFLSLNDINKARSEIDKFRNTIGINTYSLFLSPERMQKILDSFQQKHILNTKISQNQVE